MKWPLFFVSYGRITFYRLRPPPPARPPYERPALDPIDLDADDLFDELGDVDLFAELGDDDLFDELGDVDLFDVDGLFDALLAVDAPFEVRPACDFVGLVEARLEADDPFETRPAWEVEGRDPPWPAVLKFPFLTLLFTVREVFLVFLL